MKIKGLTLLNKLSKREKILFCIVVVSALVALYLYRYFFPALNNYRKLETQIQKLKNNIEVMGNARELKALEQKKLLETKQDLAQATTKFSTNLQDGLFLVRFSRKLQQENVVLDKFSPREIVTKEDIIILPIDLELNGNYLQVVKIVAFLENQENLTEIRDLKLEPEIKQDSEQGSEPPLNDINNGAVNASLLLLIYSKPTPEGKLVLKDLQNWQYGRANPFVSLEKKTTSVDENNTKE
ncbi:type 4a pilus biogenesis protein PilO [Bacillota bacterium LX-D]|nr:type 4a pilus biogenesis protein PilO [Bacillota bacterium LX-D]